MYLFTTSKKRVSENAAKMNLTIKQEADNLAIRKMVVTSNNAIIAYASIYAFGCRSELEKEIALRNCYEELNSQLEGAKHTIKALLYEPMHLLNVFEDSNFTYTASGGKIIKRSVKK